MTKTFLRLAAMLVVVAVAACGNGEAPDAQPVEDAAAFDDGAFGDLPLFPKSDPLGEVARSDDTVSRSYRATMASPAMVLDFYEDSLVDWQVIEAPKQIGAGSTMRGIWRDGNLELTVSATEGPTVPEEGAELGDAGAAVSQYSLSLRDRG
jgi:hypothetical protein